MSLVFCEKIKAYANAVVANLETIPERIDPAFAARLEREARAAIIDAGDTPTRELVMGVVLYSTRIMARVERRRRIADWTFRTHVGSLVEVPR